MARVSFTQDEIEHVFKEYVFGFMTHDIERVIARADTGPSENVLAALGLLTFTEFMGWFVRRASNIKKDKNEEQASFEFFFRRLGPAYAALLDTGVKVYRDFRSSLVHQYAIREAFDVDLPGRRASCGIYLNTDAGRYHIACGRYFEDFGAASRTAYRELTGNEPPAAVPASS
jgi:hypothetical protein